MLYIRDFEKMGATFKRERVELIDDISFYNLGSLHIDDHCIYVRVYFSKYSIPKIVGVQGDDLNACVNDRRIMLQWVVKNILHNKNGIWLTLIRRWSKRFLWAFLITVTSLVTCINLWSLSKESSLALFVLCGIGAVLLTVLLKRRGRFFYERMR